MNSTRPRRIRALWSSGVAVGKSSVISLAIEPRPFGPMMAQVKWLALDRTSTTIMVSPRPRPKPNRKAPTMPSRENGKMTSVTIPQRVPPRPRAASQASRGVWAMTSLLTEVMMGTSVAAQISPQAKMDCTNSPGVGVRKNGTKPKWSTIHLAGAACRLETSARPQNP